MPVLKRWRRMVALVVGEGVVGAGDGGEVAVNVVLVSEKQVRREGCVGAAHGMEVSRAGKEPGRGCWQ